MAPCKSAKYSVKESQVGNHNYDNWTNKET